MTSAFSWQNSISLCPVSFCTPRLKLPVTDGNSISRSGRCHWKFHRGHVESIGGFGNGGLLSTSGRHELFLFLSPFICSRLVISKQTKVLLHITPENRVGWGVEVKLVNAK